MPLQLFLKEMKGKSPLYCARLCVCACVRRCMCVSSVCVYVRVGLYVCTRACVCDMHGYNSGHKIPGDDEYT